MYKGTEKERVEFCLMGGQLPKKDFNRKWDPPIADMITILCSSSSFGDHLPEGILQPGAPWPIALFPPLTAPRNFNSCQMSGRI